MTHQIRPSTAGSRQRSDNEYAYGRRSCRKYALYAGSLLEYDCDQIQSSLERKKENEIYKHIYLDSETAQKLGTIPEGVTRICLWSFSDNSTTKEIIMPNSVTSIEYSSFRKLVQLTRIVLSTNLKNFVLNPNSRTFMPTPRRRRNSSGRKTT